MSDGLLLNAGSGGATLATDDAGAAGHVQLVKLAIATDGSATPIPSDGTAGLTVTLTAQPGTDLLDCTVNNSDGTASVPVQGAAAAGAALAGNPVTIAASDGTNAQIPRLYDSDSGAGVEYTLGVLLRAAASGGSVGITGDAGNGLDVDVTRVSGNVTVIQGTGTNLHTVVDSGAITATLAAETTKVIGTVNVAASQTIAVTQATASNLNATVTATALDVRALTATDVVTVTGGAGQTADVKVTLDSESVAVTNAGITTIAGAVAGTEMQVDVITMPTTTVTATNLDIRDLTSASDSVGAVAAGDIAHDSADSGNPVKIGAKAVTALPAVVAANDRANAISDVHGRLIIANEAPGDLISAGQTATVADTTVTDVLGAAGANTKWRITAIGVYNSDATVGTWVKVQDDTSGTPIVYWRGYAAAAGGGFNLNFNPPLPASGQANGKVQMVCETTGAEVGCSVVGFKVPG